MSARISCTMSSRTALGALAWIACGTAFAAGPSFDCAKAAKDSIESMVCADAGLSALDRTMAQVFAEASKRGASAPSSTLQATQRGWIKGRDDCWKSDDRRACVETEYQQRIAELQATYRLIEPVGSAHYACPETPAVDIFATYFPTDPPSATAKRGDATELLFAQMSGSGARYGNGNTTIWEHAGEAVITWGAGGAEMQCKIVR